MKKNVSLRQMLNLDVLSKREQEHVKGGKIDHGGCSCPCNASIGDMSGYYIFDNLWAQQPPDWP